MYGTVYSSYDCTTQTIPMLCKGIVRTQHNLGRNGEISLIGTFVCARTFLHHFPGNKTELSLTLNIIMILCVSYG